MAPVLIGVETLIDSHARACETAAATLDVY